MTTIRSDGVIIISSQGAQGIPGQGVSAGGATGQILYKTSGVDYATAWETLTTSIVAEGSNLYFTDERAQDAIGAMINATLVYNDVTPSLGRAAIAGDITIPANSNASTLATVNSNIGTFGDALNIPQVTVNGKGLITAITSNIIAGLDISNFTSTNISQWTNNSGYITAAALTGLVPYTGATSNVDLGAHSITATGFLGNASSSTILQTARNIYGESFNGSADLSGVIAVGFGGTGQSAYTNGQILMGRTSDGVLVKGTITPGGGVLITNGAGTVTISTPGIYNVVADFGADPTGVIDSTTTIQAGIDFVQTNHATLYFPPGTYKITAKLNFKCLPGWGMQGSGMGQVTILQYTDNIPIFDMGIIAASSLTKYFLDGLSFDYHNLQTGNTNANCILYSGEAFQGRVTNIEFVGGYRGIYVAAGVNRPWGTSWDNLFWNRNVTGCAMDTTAGLGDTPNNHYGRLAVDATNMTTDIFSLHGYDSTIATIEVFTSPNSIRVLSFAINAIFAIGTIKLETYSFTGTTGLQGIINITHGSLITIDNIWLGNTSTITMSSGYVSLINCQNGGTTFTRLKVGAIRAILTNALVGTAVLVSGGGTSTNGVEIGSVDMSGGWTLQNNGSTVIANVLRVKDYSNGYLGADVGDADLTLVSGDPTTQQFKTAFTSPRTINLPNVANNLCGGMSYTFIFNGAINGANTATIKAGGTTYAVLTSDGFITLQWRRTTGTAANDWAIVDKNSNVLPSGDILVGNASNVATAVALSGDATLANTGAITVSKIGGNAVTLGGAVTFSGAFTTTATITANSAFTFPISGTLLSTTSSAGSFPTLNQNTSGNAATATALATPRAINGVNFDGSAPITITAAAGTLSGATLAAGVTASSLISLGTLLAALKETPVVANTGSAYTIDPANGAEFNLTLNAATPVLTLQTVIAGVTQSVTGKITQDGVGGRVPTWANVTWIPGSAPTVPTAATTGTVWVYLYSDGVTWYGTYNNSATGTGLSVNATNPTITVPLLSGGLCSTPTDSNTATTAFGTSLTLGTAIQNTTGYDIIVNVGLSATAATTATIVMGVGSTSTPTTNTVIPSFSAACAFTITAYVPNSYYLLVNKTGTLTSTNNIVVTPA